MMADSSDFFQFRMHSPPGRGQQLAIPPASPPSPVRRMPRRDSVVPAGAKLPVPTGWGVDMTPEPPATVFASYSRVDGRLVTQLLGLFAAVDVPVFRDEQSVKPGQKWRIAIDEAIEQCQTILVFWCEHAAQSSEVRSEYEHAIALGKRVVPVLMDQTALPPNLGQYQGLDLRSHHNFILSNLDDPKCKGFDVACPPRRSYR